MTPADPDQVVAAARFWFGTPYHDQASLKGVGCDFLGLARGIWREVVGPEPIPIPPYRRDWGETGPREVLAEGARRMMPEIAPADATLGALVLFRMMPRAIAKHVGIVTGPDTFLHAYERLGVRSARPVTKGAPVFEGPVADPPSCCQLNLGQACVSHFRFLSCDLNGRNANFLRVQHDASRRVLLTMPAPDSASGLYLLRVAQFLIFERQHIFEAVDHAPAELHEARSFAAPPPPLKCPRANSPSGSQIDLTEANFSHLRFLSNDLRGRTTTNA